MSVSNDIRKYEHFQADGYILEHILTQTEDRQTETANFSFSAK